MTTIPITDESRKLRYDLCWLCERYNLLLADKDALDVRLGYPEPYIETAGNLDAERVYESESHAITSQIRDVIAKMHQTLEQIRALEGF
jgi:hypothetical protein